MLEKTGVFIEDSKFGGPQRLLVNIFKEKKLKKIILIFVKLIFAGLKKILMEYCFFYLISYLMFLNLLK